MQAHLDVDVIDVFERFKGVQHDTQEDMDQQDHRRAHQVYTEALGSLMCLHRDLLTSLPKSRSKSQLGGRRGKKVNGTSRKDGGNAQRSRSVLPSLTNVDSLQQVYADIKGLDMKHPNTYLDDPHLIQHALRGTTTAHACSPWQTTGDGKQRAYDMPFNDQRPLDMRLDKQRADDLPCDAPFLLPNLSNAHAAHAAHAGTTSRRERKTMPEAVNSVPQLSLPRYLMRKGASTQSHYATPSSQSDYVAPFSGGPPPRAPSSSIQVYRLIEPRAQEPLKKDKTRSKSQQPTEHQEPR